MNEVEFKFQNDTLLKYTPLPQYGNGIYQIDIVIDKETFIKCYKEWIKEEEGDINE